MGSKVAIAQVLMQKRVVNVVACILALPVCSFMPPHVPVVPVCSLVCAPGARVHVSLGVRAPERFETVPGHGHDATFAQLEVSSEF